MRKKERINPILARISWVEFLADVVGLEPDAVMTTSVEIYKRDHEIQEFWLNYPDLRLTQVLVSMGIITNNPGGWYYIEEVNWMVTMDPFSRRDILFWGTFGPEGKDKVEQVPLGKMTDKHIKNCLDNVENMDPLYHMAMTEELKSRV